MGKAPTTDTVHKLQKLYRANPGARRLLDALAARARDATETSIENIMRIAGLGRADAIQLAREIEETGSGEMYLGRRGGKTRIVWEFSCISVGQAATGEAKELEAPQDPEPEELSGAEAIDKGDESALMPPIKTIADAKTALARALGLQEANIEIIIKA